MGDRRNIIIREKEGDQAIYFYSHFGGEGLPACLADALKRGEEMWDDSAYLNRIIFSDMIAGRLPSLSGTGISLELQDTNYPDNELCVYHKEQEVRIGGKVWTFQEFSELSFEDKDVEEDE